VAIMAVLPYGVRYGAEARMYSLTITLVLAGYLLVDDLLSGRSDGVRRLLCAGGVILVTAALLWNHYWSMWLLAAVGLCALWTAVKAREPRRRTGARLLVGGLVLGGVLFLPWMPSLMYQSAHTGTPWGERFGPASVVVISIVDFAGARHGAAQLLSYLLVPLVLMATTVIIMSGTRPPGATRPERARSTAPSEADPRQVGERQGDQRDDSRKGPDPAVGFSADRHPPVQQQVEERRVAVMTEGLTDLADR